MNTNINPALEAETSWYHRRIAKLKSQYNAVDAQLALVRKALKQGQRVPPKHLAELKRKRSVIKRQIRENTLNQRRLED